MPDGIRFVLPYNKRPFFSIPSDNGGEIKCLLDTGANIPIWFADEDSLVASFPEAITTKWKTDITGLGQNPHENIPIWMIPVFRMRDDSGNHISFNQFLIPVLKAKKFPFHMILPATLFNKMFYSFDYMNSQTKGELFIKSVKDEYYVRPIFDSEYAKSIGKLNKENIFTQD